MTPAANRTNPASASERPTGLRPARRRDDRGASTAIVVLFAIALLSVAGLVIDGGYTLASKRAAMNHAEQAARAGADALSQAALRDGTPTVDPAKAAAAARRYLDSVGAHGTITVTGDTVSVTVADQHDTAILSAVGVSSISVRATATARSIDADD
jgi:Flp pilus assembly protein TadG